MKKEDMIKIIDHFEGLHNINDNSLILGDFNFVEFDLDKKKHGL